MVSKYEIPHCVEVTPCSLLLETNTGVLLRIILKFKV